ncbi:porin family protein [Gaoshiqia sediminis]|uniref:PorT family protein n=1 Tax=Gaoshiqia sediminis TaxID=2986998 RepID=A0AA41Y5K6_9BACT|nr:porin family protein [Gaoshiqia sediminis]MCW0481537.1 PorT family protein [Gaoshiqia sediminis]
MKKLVGITCLLLAVLAVSAQRFDAGMLAGLNASQVEGDFTKGYHKPGFVAGLFVQTNLSRTVFAAMEMKYAQKGSRKSPDKDEPELEKYIMRLGYVDLPVYLGFRTNETLSVIVGLSAGYLVSSGEYNNYGLFPEEDRHPFNEFDFQALLGARYEIADRLSFDLRLAYSFMPIRDLNGDVLWYWWDDQYNKVITSGLYYRFGK